MRRRLLLGSLVALFATASSQAVSFQQPTSSDVWEMGTTQDILWTKVAPSVNPDENYLSVRMYQVYQNDTFNSSFTYLARNRPPDTITIDGWAVDTDVNLTFANRFILGLYLETQTDVLASSRIFAIKAKSVAETPSSSSSSSSVSSVEIIRTSSTTSKTTTTAAASSTVTSSFLTSTTATEATASESPTTTPVLPASGMGTMTKIGIGAGVAGAVFVGLGLGWFFFARRKVPNEQTQSLPPGYYDAKWQAPPSSLSGHGLADRREVRSQLMTSPNGMYELAESHSR